MRPMIRNIAFITVSLIAGTILGMLAVSTLAALIFFLFMDASWNWAIGFGLYLGAIPGAVIGFIGGTYFGLFRFEPTERYRQKCEHESSDEPYDNGNPFVPYKTKWPR